MLPATPVVAVGATTKWAADKVGPMAWFVLALLAVGGVVMYRRQPQERKERIKTFASSTGQFLLDEYTRATYAVQQAEDQLGAFVVRGPEERSVTSAVFRKDRPAVDPLRRYLHGKNTTVFREVRRGGFVLGGRYQVRQAIQA
jgi:hypothetical protein